MTAHDEAEDGDDRAAGGPDEIALAWADHVAHQRETFINEMVSLGMKLEADRSEGAKSDATLANDRVTVTLDEGFPYTPPKVRTTVAGPRSWHQDSKGVLCLYTSTDSDGLPWLDTSSFLERIAEWFTKNEVGWPDDPPVLDLEAYLNLPWDRRFVLYADLDRHDADYIQLREDRAVIRIVGGGRLPKNSGRGLLSGFVADIGDVAQPPLNWDDLIEGLTDAERIRGAIERERVDVLLVRYHRRGPQGPGAVQGTQHGVIAVTFPAPTATKSGHGKGKARRSIAAGARRPHLAFSGAIDDAAMRLRSGTAAADLADKRVYLLGAGALGSHIADGLSRAGLGHLTIRDYDIVRPGNVTRHLAANLDWVGAGKAQVVKLVLENRPYNRTRIKFDARPVRNPADAAALLVGEHLVVDATADGSVLHLLQDAREITGGRFVTACLQNDGRSMRVDVVPPFGDADPLPATTIRPSAAPDAFEAGCGEPISPTPPHAVAEAAAMTVRHIIGLLADSPQHPAGEHRVVK